MHYADLDLNKIYTYADYFKWQFEERVELIKGKIFTMSAPNRMHQTSSVILATKLYNFLENHPCNVFTATFDVRFPPKKTKIKIFLRCCSPIYV